MGLNTDLETLLEFGEAEPVQAEPRVGAEGWVLEPVTDGPLTDWLAKHRDPGLWHAALVGAATESAFLWLANWMITQPDCENEIVAYILWVFWQDLCGPPPAADGDRPDVAAIMGRAVAVIAARELAMPFRSSGLSGISEAARCQLLDRCFAANIRAREAGTEPLLRAPVRLLRCVPTGPAPSTAYHVEDGRIYRWVPRAA